MSADIVERLRAIADDRDAFIRAGTPIRVNATVTEWIREAADEIERLRQYEPAPHPDGHDL